RSDALEPPKADRITKDSGTLKIGIHHEATVAQRSVATFSRRKRRATTTGQIVFAVNNVGSSDPSRPSNPIVIEEQPNKPVMNLGGVRDITVRAGEDFSNHVPYIGFPKPTATWFANDVVNDETDARVRQQLADHFASLVVKTAR
ncbi:Twitchin, partial [Ooceraea biroi]